MMSRVFLKCPSAQPSSRSSTDEPRSQYSLSLNVMEVFYCIVFAWILVD